MKNVHGTEYVWTGVMHAQASCSGIESACGNFPAFNQPFKPCSYQSIERRF